MLRASIDQATPGMELALPVFHPRGGNRLLAAGFELDAKTIRRLRELSVFEVWVTYPDAKLIQTYISPRIMEKQAAVLTAVSDMFQTLHENLYADFNFSDYLGGIGQLIDAIGEEPHAATYVAEMAGRAESDFRHAAAVATLSLLMGLKLRDYLVQQRRRLSPRYARNVSKLALGAMLHDIGLLRIDPDVAQRVALGTVDEGTPAWRSHPRVGFRMISSSIDPSASIVVLQHHQYFDGSGYSARDSGDESDGGLAGEDIHIFARIVCVADHYDRLRHAPGRSRPLPRVEVLRRMLESPLARRFDPVVLRALLSIVPAYAPGSLVRLNSGASAIVLSWNLEEPCRPLVQLRPEGDAPDSSRSSKHTHYDLAQRRDLWITHDGDDDVASCNFDLPLEYTAGRDAA